MAAKQVDSSKTLVANDDAGLSARIDILLPRAQMAESQRVWQVGATNRRVKRQARATSIANLWQLTAQDAACAPLSPPYPPINGSQFAAPFYPYMILPFCGSECVPNASLPTQDPSIEHKTSATGAPSRFFFSRDAAIPQHHYPPLLAENGKGHSRDQQWCGVSTKHRADQQFEHRLCPSPGLCDAASIILWGRSSHKSGEQAASAVIVGTFFHLL